MQVTKVVPKQDKKKKFQDKLEGILEKVVFNSCNIFTTFQESAALLKKMNKYITIILKTLITHL